MDTPLPKIRMSGMLFYRLGAKGFLHWGYNYWHKMESEEMGDPFEHAPDALGLVLAYERGVTKSADHARDYTTATLRRRPRKCTINLQ